MKTYIPKKDEIERKWHLVDVKGEILGRVSSKIASLLIGKGKPKFVYHMDIGDYVVVINADQIRVTGNKLKQKMYRHHTGYPGNLKEASLREVLAKKPERVIQMAVSKMLPKNKLRSGRMRRLKVFAGEDHPFEDKKLEKAENGK